MLTPITCTTYIKYVYMYLFLLTKYFFQLYFIKTNATIFKDLKCKTSTYMQNKMHCTYKSVLESIMINLKKPHL